MISAREALERVLALAGEIGPVGEETVALAVAQGRVLRRAAAARRTQPPFAGSAMDGYALRAADAVAPGARLVVAGEIAAGGALGRALRPGEAARIFTGAPLPEGADAVIAQEDAVAEAGSVVFTEAARLGRHVRAAGGDFSEGDVVLDAPRRLSAEDVALAAAAGWPQLTVARRPRALLLTVGDELRFPGEPLGPSDIVASNAYGVAALLAAAGAEPTLSPAIPDDLDALRAAIRGAAGFDLVITLGGASVGDHDLTRPAFAAEGVDLSFYKIAMRPGKPLMAGRYGGALAIGLPGNPVSAMLGARLFAAPAARALLGLSAGWPALRKATLAVGIGENGPREHFMRARLESDGRVRVFGDQDSSRLRVLSAADALVARPPHDPPRKEGDIVNIALLRVENLE